jgi:hypothetical protein
MEKEKIQRSEVEYVFHLICQWVEVTTGYKIADTAILKKVCDQLYRDKDLAFIADIVNALCRVKELVNLFEIYQKDKVASSPEMLEVKQVSADTTANAWFEKQADFKLRVDEQQTSTLKVETQNSKQDTKKVP